MSKRLPDVHGHKREAFGLQCYLSCVTDWEEELPNFKRILKGRSTEV
jgi:hypothetical protein